MHSENNRLKADEAASYLGVSISTLAKWRWLGTGPRFVRVGRSIRYQIEDLQSYLSTNSHQSTSEYAR